MGIALRHGQMLEPSQHRCQQLVQPGKGELHLRLDPRGAQHAAARRMLDDVLEQRGLAHARLATHHQRPALTRADSLDEPVEHRELAAPARQLVRAPSDGGEFGHLTDTDGTRVPTSSDWPLADAKRVRVA
jgi:hypothetical protein